MLCEPCVAVTWNVIGWQLSLMLSVGVPLIVPVAALPLKPRVGSPLKLQVMGVSGVELEAENTYLYASPAVPEGNVQVLPVPQFKESARSRAVSPVT
jgi:hypothetical protein